MRERYFYLFSQFTSQLYRLTQIKMTAEYHANSDSYLQYYELNFSYILKVIQ